MFNHFNEKTLHTVDPKGRLLLPKEVRQAFKMKKGDIVYLLPNLSDPPYLEIRTARQWEDYRQSLRQQAAGEKKKDSFRYAMMLLGKSTVDGQGRVLIPQRMRDNCKLNGTVAVVDMESYTEVWCTEHMEKKYADMVRAFKEANDQVY